MLTSLDIKKKAKELGATVCGIGKIYEETNTQRDPRSILPDAKCIIGFTRLWLRATSTIPIPLWVLNT